MQVHNDAKPYDTINVTPMLDLAYVLLVVFILMTTATIQGLSVSMPKPSNKPATEQHELKVIQVTSTGATLLNYTTGAGEVQGECAVTNGIVYVPLDNGSLLALGQ